MPIFIPRGAAAEGDRGDSAMSHATAAANAE